MANSPNINLMCDNPVAAAENRKRIAETKSISPQKLPQENPTHKAICVYCDGSTTDICFVVTHSGKILTSVRKPATDEISCTSNEGEYWAVIHALTWLSAHDMWSATILADSLLIVSQICGLNRCKEPRLQKLLAIVRAQLIGMSVDFHWVPRGENLAGLVLEEKADGLAPRT